MEWLYNLVTNQKNMPPLLVLAIDGVHVELGKKKNDDNPQGALIHTEDENHNSPVMDHQDL